MRAPETEAATTKAPGTEAPTSKTPETEATTTTAPDNGVPEGFKERKHRWLSMVIPEDYIEATVSGVRMLVPSGFLHPDDSIAFTESEAYVEAATESAVKDYFESTYLDKYGIEISNFTYKRTVIPGADMIITSFTFLDKGVDYIQTACFAYNDNDLIAVMFTDTSRIYTEAFKTSINSIHVSE